MKILLAKNSHIQDIVLLWKDFMDFHKAIDPHYSRNKDALNKFEKFIKRWMKSKDGRVIVALDGQYVVGFALAMIFSYPPVIKQKLHGYIDTVAVKKGFRRKGVGEKMVSDLFKWFKKRGMDRIELSVITKNKSGRTFWKKLGFADYQSIMFIEK